MGIIKAEEKGGADRGENDPKRSAHRGAGIPPAPPLHRNLPALPRGGAGSPCGVKPLFYFWKKEKQSPRPNGFAPLRAGEIVF